jgi:hypothetical protein
MEGASAICTRLGSERSTRTMVAAATVSGRRAQIITWAVRCMGDPWRSKMNVMGLGFR